MSLAPPFCKIPRLQTRLIHNVPSKKTGSENTYSPDKIHSLPDTIIRVYHLNSGPKIRVYTLEGYDYHRSSGGWKYYCTPQNGEKRIRGDGTSVDDGNDIAFFP